MDNYQRKSGHQDIKPSGNQEKTKSILYPDKLVTWYSDNRFLLTLFAAAASLLGTFSVGIACAAGVWEKVEIGLYAEKTYENPYKEVEVWVDLKGPGFEKRCYGFWDGDNVFRVRVLGTAAGTWSWKSGSNQQDTGLNGKSGSFEAIAWSEAQKEENPCRRGMVKASANGHAFEWADGTPFFLLGDTWGPGATFR